MNEHVSCRSLYRERPPWRSVVLACARNATGGVPYRALLAAALAAAMVLFGPEAAWACPSCKAALAAQEGGGDLIRGFFWSILFMMSMPFLLLGSFSGYMYLLVRRAKAEKPADDPEEV